MDTSGNCKTYQTYLTNDMEYLYLTQLYKTILRRYVGPTSSSGNDKIVKGKGLRRALLKELSRRILSYFGNVQNYP